MDSFCDVQSTWVTQQGDLSEVVLYREEGNEESGNLESQCDMPKSGGIYLQRLDENVLTAEDIRTGSCKINFSTHSPSQGNIQISAVDILCDALKAEFFSQSDGYLCTEKATEISEDLFMLQHTFDTPVKACSIQLLQTSKANIVWIHSIHITVLKKMSALSVYDSMQASLGLKIPTAPEKINIDKVKSMIAESGCEMPKGAQDLLQSLETFQKNSGPFSGMSAMPQLAVGSSPSPGGFQQMASLMSAFVGMQVTQRNQQKEAQTTISATREHTTNSDADKCDKAQTVASPEDLQTACSVLSTDNFSVSNCMSSCGNVDNTVQSSQVPASDSSKTKTHKTCQSPAGNSAFADFEHRLSVMFAATEERILTKVHEHVKSSESRIQAKLDMMMDQLSVLQHQKSSGSNLDSDFSSSSSSVL